MISILVITVLIISIFISTALNFYSKEYLENNKSYKLFKIGGIFILLTYSIPQIIVAIINVINKKETIVKVTLEDLTIWFICISFFIIALLLQIIEGINKIRGDLNFKIGDILQITDESENKKSYKIKKIKYGYIHYYNMDHPYNIENEEINKILTKIEKGIIVLKKD